jgi:acyl-CoA synthetase (AMP-forming)/AMP-acid ligase II
MLSLATRDQFTTLLDAVTLKSADEQPAIIYVATNTEPIIITRERFLDACNSYAFALWQAGIRPHDLVIIAHTQNLESVFLFWGALLISAIPSMFPVLTEKLDAEVYVRDLGELVRLSDVRAVFTTDDFAPQLALRVKCAVYGSCQLIEKFQYSVSRTFYSQLPLPDDIAFLQHSSGTTGLQKGVALSHAVVLNQLASYAEVLRLNSMDVIVSWLPLYHDMGLVAGFIQPLVQGVPLVLMSPFDWVRHPSLLLRAIHDYRGTLCWLPNFAYNHCVRAIRERDVEQLDLSSMRAFVNCSEPVRHDSHMSFVERFAANGVTLDKLTVSYAMAENTFAVTQSPPGKYPPVDTVDRLILQNKLCARVAVASERSETLVSCGKPISGVQVKVVDGNGLELGERCVGEVCVKGASMLAGYYKRSDLSPFDQEGWYRTGDMGYIADGEVYIVGRSKDLIINAGKNIYPQDLEAIVNTVPGVYPGRAVAFGVFDECEGTELIAVVAEVSGNDLSEHKRIMRDIRRLVSCRAGVTVSYLTLVKRGWLIKTSSGKIARSKNREKWLQGRQNGAV